MTDRVRGCQESGSSTGDHRKTEGRGGGGGGRQAESKSSAENALEVSEERTGELRDQVPRGSQAP